MENINNIFDNQQFYYIGHTSISSIVKYINKDIFNESNKKALLLGYIENNFGIDYEPNNNILIINILSDVILKLITEISSIKYEISIDNKQIKFINYNIVDFLYIFFKDENRYYINESSLYYVYLKLCTFDNFNKNKIPKCTFEITSSDAVFPSRNRISDIGYDISIINEYKSISNIIKLYDTGIKISPPYGYYIEILPRSSLSKSGYMLSNSVGIIDPAYSGTLLVALTKIDNSKDDLEFPFKCCQIILRKQLYFDLEVVTNINNNTSRGEGSFGSTNLL